MKLHAVIIPEIQHAKIPQRLIKLNHQNAREFVGLCKSLKQQFFLDQQRQNKPQNIIDKTANPKKIKNAPIWDAYASELPFSLSFNIFISGSYILIK